MIGFASIAGGAPSSVGSLTDHLMNNTLTKEMTDIAAYYGRGMVEDPLMVQVAWAVAEGEMLYSEGIAELYADHVSKRGPGRSEDWNFDDPIDPAERRLAHRLDVLSDRMQEGLMDGPLAVVRPDIHPLALVGLGIEADGMLSGAEINALLAGRRADGDLIGGKRYVDERRLPVDPKTGDKRFSTPIGSYDFCPTPDKSVSVAWAFASPVEQAQIYNAHIEAAREAVGYIATEVGRARLGDGGNKGSETGHVAWLEFTHHTSRRVQITSDEGGAKITPDAGSPGDPDLHTHFLIPNAVFCESGRVGSLDTAAIGGFIFEADAFYHATLGQKLRDAGFEVELDHKTGAARMPIVPDEVRTLFSKRTLAGEALARTMAAGEGLDWDALAPEQRATRIKNATQSFDQKQKGGKDDLADVADWRRQAKVAHGWEPETLQLYGPPPPPLTQEQRIRQAYEVALPHLAEKLEHKSVVPHFDLRVAALRGLVDTGISGLGDVTAVTQIMREEGVQQYGEKTAIAWGVEAGKRYNSVTTTLHQSDEREFVRLAQAAAGDRSSAIAPRLLQQKIEGSGLDFSGAHGQAQRAAIERLGQGGQFGIMIGAAGSGKSATLKPLVAAWKDQGREVYGASLAWRQADDLVDAGIDSRNVKAFSVLISGLQDGSIKMARKSVVAVDEWGLLGTRQGLELLRLREKHGFQVVALGDDKQCASIEAGAIIDLSRRALGVDQVPTILTTRRQQTEREREIVGLFREGRAAEALTLKRADGSAEMVPGGYDEVVGRVAKRYAARLQATGEAPTISAPTNSDAQRIGAAVRAERRALGLLGPDLVTAKATDGERDIDLPLAKGDRVRLFRSTGADFGAGRGGRIGRNGSVLEVIDADTDGLTLKARTGTVGHVKWEALTGKKSDRAWLAYGDAMTIHTAQGSTANEHIFALPSGSQAVNGLSGYTADTRHRSVSYLVTSEQAERIEVRKRRPLNDARPITADDTWANVARSFSYQPEKDSALALSDRVGRLRRGTVKTFHKTLLPTEPAHRAGDSWSPGADIVRRQKVDGMTKDAPRLAQAVRRGVERVRQVYQRATHRQAPTIERGPSLSL